MSCGLFSFSKFNIGLIAGLLCGGSCRNVQAQTTELQDRVQNHEGVRVATAIADPAKPAAPFSRATATPWTTMGSQSGYVNIRLAEAMRYTLLQERMAMFKSAVDGALLPTDDGTMQTSGDFGFSLDRISSLDATVTLTLSRIPPEERDESGATRKFGIGINGSNNGFAICSETEVDWPGLLKAVDFERYFGEISGEQLRAGFLEKSAASRDLSFLSKPEKKAKARKHSMASTKTWAMAIESRPGKPQMDLFVAGQPRTVGNLPQLAILLERIGKLLFLVQADTNERGESDFGQEEYAGPQRVPGCFWFGIPAGRAGGILVRVPESDDSIDFGRVLAINRSNHYPQRYC